MSQVSDLSNILLFQQNTVSEFNNRENDRKNHYTF